MIDYRELLKKYMQLAIEHQEFDYLGYAGPNGLNCFDQQELDELYNFRKEILGE